MGLVLNSEPSTMLVTTFTKRLSWEEIKDDLGARQELVLKGLELLNSETRKPVSASELAFDMWKSKKFHTPDRNNVHPRLNELVALGFVGVAGKRKCTITGKTVAVYHSLII